MSGSAFNFASSIFPVIHEIFRAKQMPAMIKTFPVVVSPPVQIEQLKLSIFVIGNNVPYPSIIRTIKKFLH
ncbi:hypothetical protein D3C86_1997570 [compost metagenome]